MTQPTIACDGPPTDRAMLLEQARHTAGGLLALGVEPGDRVVLIARNSVEFIEITLAAGMAGSFAVPINWHFTATEIASLLEDCEPRVIFVERDLLASLPAPWRGRAAVIVIGPDGDGASYAGWRAGQPAYQGEQLIAPGSIVYTSGTTGRPKGVRRALPTRDQQQGLRTLRSHLYGIGADSRVLVPGPLYHSFPNQVATHAALAAAHCEITSRFDAENLLATIARERITSVALAPIMFVRLLRLPAPTRAAYDLSSLRWAIHAGGPCAEDVKRAMIDWWGPIITEYYGGTETGPLTLCTSDEWLRHPGTCGKPLDGVTLRVVDAAGKATAAGVPGEIFGRLWCYPDFTYHNDPGKRADVALGELVSLGDIGLQDGEGYLYLCDRARDMVVSGGVNIYPAEVENALFSLPGVVDCAAFGVADPEYGETLVAFVCGTDTDSEALRGGLRSLIAGYKVPRSIVMVASLDRDPSGKVRKPLLRERYLAMPRAGQAAGG